VNKGRYKRAQAAPVDAAARPVALRGGFILKTGHGSIGRLPARTTEKFARLVARRDFRPAAQLLRTPISFPQLCLATRQAGGGRRAEPRRATRAPGAHERVARPPRPCDLPVVGSLKSQRPGRDARPTKTLQV